MVDDTPHATISGDGQPDEHHLTDGGLDDALDALSACERRVAVAYLSEVDDETVPIERVRDRIVDAIADADAASAADARRVETSLRHVHLPKLADVGAISIHGDELSYEGAPVMEALLDGFGPP